MNIQERLKEALGEEWYEALKDYLLTNSFYNILKTISKARQKYRIIPDEGSNTFFRAFRISPISKVKVIILGMDPYPTIESSGIHTFDGLAFSNNNSLRASPSLRNIFKEIKDDIGYKFPDDIDTMDLTRWARQGVLLINTAHTVPFKSPGKHIKLWEPFTTKVLEILNTRDDLVWLLFGRNAHKYKDFITNKSHSTICTSHPSPLGALKESGGYPAFIGSKCFSRCNEELRSRNLKEVIW